MTQQTPRLIQAIEIDFYNPKGNNTDFPEFGKYIVITAAFFITLLTLFIWNWITTSSIEDTNVQVATNQSTITELQARLNNQNSKISMEHWSDVPNALQKEKANVRAILSQFADYLPADSSVSELKISIDRNVSAIVTFGSLRSMVAFREAISSAKEFQLITIGDYKRDAVPQANSADNGNATQNTAYEPLMSLRIELAMKSGAFQEGGTP